jgi:hypothetical protein
MKPKCWKRMSSGKYVDVNNLTEDQLDIKDIEVSLNHIIRFNGHYSDVEPLTVAQHSFLCLTLAEMIELDDVQLHKAVFTHDFAECYFGDISSPAKKAMGDSWRDFASPIEELVERKFTGVVGAELADRVKVYDLLALDIERRVMWSSQYGKDKWPMAPFSIGSLEDKKMLFNMAKEEEYVEIEKIWRKFT